MPLKILIFADQFVSNTQTFVYQHAIGLQQNHEVVVACLNRQNEDIFPFHNVNEIAANECKIRSVIRNRLYKYDLYFTHYNPNIKKAIQKLIYNFQPDIIHCHFGDKAFILIDNLARNVYNGPIFITFHGIDGSKKIQLYKTYRKKLQHLLNQKNIFPIAVSHYMVNYIASYNIPTNRFEVVYSGVDTNIFQPIPKPDNAEKTFLQIAGFRKKKAHITTITAFHQFLKKADRPCKLIFAGSGSLEEEARILVQQLDIEPLVSFLGWVTQKEAKKLLSTADIFIYPSITTDNGDKEGIPVAIMEAMAMELPIFSTLHSGIPELVEHGVNGLLAPERDIDTYVEYMEQLLEWGPQPQNRTKIIEHFSHEAHINQLISAYQKAINAK
jgi:colanic acid/amylovoran biosynthesis glycosyltransferase